MKKKSKKTKILITGVAGLIGSHLLDALLKKNKYQIIGVDNFLTGRYENIQHQAKNPNFEFYKLDILDFDKLKKIGRGIDVIIHEAAHKKISEEQPALELLINNSMGTKNVLELASIRKAKVILASSSDVYGRLTKIPFKENDELVLGESNVKRWAYATAKLFEEQLSFAYYKDRKVPIVVLRYFGTFGPRATVTWSGGHIPIFVDRIFHKKLLIIHGSGKQTRCMNYITDTVEPTILAMEKPKAVGEIINIGSKEEISVLDAAKLIHKILCQLSNQKFPLVIKHIPQKKIFGDYKEIMRRVPDLSKCKKVLGYSPKLNFEKGLELYIGWYLKNQKAKF